MIVNIDAALLWNDTQLVVEAGSVYGFKANGQWKDWCIPCDANGYSNGYMRLWNRFKRSQQHPWMALMGSVDQQEDFFIGTQCEWECTRSGRLYCYANDAKQFYWNNSKSLQLTIQRIR